MSHETDELARRVAVRLADLGISERAASIKATGQPDTLRFIRTRGVMPSWPKLVQIAEALDTSTDYLIGETEHPGNRELRKVASRIVAMNEHTQTMRRDTRWLNIHNEMQSRRTQWLEAEVERIKQLREAGLPFEIQTFPWEERNTVNDLPLYPTVELEPRVFRGGGDRIAAPVTGIDFTATPSLVHRPPALMGKKDAYAFNVSDAAMTRGSIDRNKLIICDPSWPVSVGDAVVVHLNPAPSDDPDTPVLYRYLTEMDAGLLTLLQAEPPVHFMVPRQEVAAVHRVATLAEILDLPQQYEV